MVSSERTRKAYQIECLIVEKGSELRKKGAEEYEQVRGANAIISKYANSEASAWVYAL